MPRREADANEPRQRPVGFAGLVLLGTWLLLLAALLSFDRFDLAANREPPNDPAHNWIGRFGATTAGMLFFGLGASAYLIPILGLGFSIAQLFSGMPAFRRKWPWAVLILLTCAGALDLATNQALVERLARHQPAPNAGFIERLTLNLSAPSAGGVVGMNLNRYCFGYFGPVGASVLFGALYLVGLYGLTNFHALDWLRGFVSRQWARWQETPPAEKELERRAKSLAKEARRLQDRLEAAEKDKPSVAADPDETNKAGLGPDLRPVPEPMVRDLSVPSLAALHARTSSPATEKVAPEQQEPEPQEVIPASEVRANSPAAAEDRSRSTTPEIESREVRSTAPAKIDVPQTPGASPTPPPAPVDPPKVPSSIAPESAPTLAKTKPATRKPKPLAVAVPPQIGNYQLPRLDLLNLPDMAAKPTESKEELMANARLMQQTLAQFGIEVALGDITKGPTITRYELHPAPGVKLEKITALTNNIAAALKAERIHILAPVPGKSSVGVEVPNAVKSKVIMRELLESEEWRNGKSRIPLALGKDVYGHPIIADLAEMPHLLIAGSTGSGKSVCINAIVASLLYRFPPDQLRFVMIDPKVVELQQYNALPHLVVPVVTDPKKVILALRWVVSEMEKRYQIFARVGVRNIRSFNERPRHKPFPEREPELPLTARREKVEAGTDGFAVEVDEEIVVPRDDDIVIPEKLSYIVVIIDELADLMLVAPADVEMAIARITQMARAAGIHCIVATQRPSVDVITGVIKANIPCRIAFQVAAKVDSRTILDAMGADKLLGKGDMLYLPPGSAKLVRAQGALVTDQEIQSVVDFIARQGKPNYDLEIHQQLSKPPSGFDDGEGIDEDEDLIQQCIEVIRSEQKASVSLMQRRLRLGYTRAARIMDELENRGIVGPSKGAEPRDILIDLDQERSDQNLDSD